jgi:hypothetical protein
VNRLVCPDSFSTCLEWGRDVQKKASSPTQMGDGDLASFLTAHIDSKHFVLAKFEHTCNPVQRFQVQVQHQHHIYPSMANLSIPLFHQNAELITNATSTTLKPLVVPNEPFVSDSVESVTHFLHREVSCEVLDELYSHLHLIATKSSSHIAALHHQFAKGRTITLTEKPGLHLIWYYGTVFIKPIPHCLLNHEFWARYL